MLSSSLANYWSSRSPFEIIIAPSKACPATMMWQIHSRGRFYHANESTVVYFDSHSGDTHLLSDFAAYVMQQFGDEPLAIDDLIERISPAIDSPYGSELQQAVSSVLEELVSLDILKRG